MFPNPNIWEDIADMTVINAEQKKILRKQYLMLSLMELPL